MARLLLLLMGVFPVLPLAAPKRGAGDTGEAAGNWASRLPKCFVRFRFLCNCARAKKKILETTLSGHPCSQL